MAVRLKTHTKVLLALAITAVTGAAAWHLGLKDLVGGGAPGEAGDDPTAASGGDKPARSGPVGSIGTAGSPLKVSIVSWHGYAPALVANGGSLKTKAGSLFEKEGVNVEFLLQDDIPPLVANFEPGIAHCSWRTIDFFAQEHPAVRGNGLDARVVMIVDNSKGSDAVIAKGDIHSIEDLAGHSVGFVQYTPSHMVLQHAIEQSSLTARKRQTIDQKFINGGTPEVRAAFEGGQIDAAVLWEPDTSLALKKVPGAHVVYSTKTATNLIYDVMVCNKAVIDAHPEVIQGFVNGWMKGVDAAVADKAAATKALRETEPLFEALIKENGDGFMDALYEGVAWTGLADNIRILGLDGDTNFAERVYVQADRIWRENTDLIAKDTPVISAAEAFDTRFLEKLAEGNAAAKEEAKKPEYTFSAAERDQAVTKKEAEVTKPVSIQFQTGSSELSKRAMQIIDTEVVPLLDSMGSAYFSVEGNTDSTGNAGANKKLSSARAQAVVDYLVKQWEYKPERFRVTGNGPAKPACNESAPEDGLKLEECQAMNRRTDVAVYSR
jgi:NitT/TauT family transport system substrate-binding protein